MGMAVASAITVAAGVVVASAACVPAALVAVVVSAAVFSLDLPSLCFELADFAAAD